ncbi:unnamed protein product [Laminaria digitata]
MSLLEEQLLSIGSAVILTFIAAWLAVKLQPRAKLQVYQPHQFSFNVPGRASADLDQPEIPNLMVHTKTILIRNAGRGSAEDVEICHGSRPENFKIFPPCDYEEFNNNESFHFVRISSMPPKTEYAIELLSGRDLPILVSVRHKTGNAQFMSMQIIPQLTHVQTYLAQALMLLGFGFTMWVLVRLLVWFVRTQVG